MKNKDHKERKGIQKSQPLVEPMHFLLYIADVSDLFTISYQNYKSYKNYYQ